MPKLKKLYTFLVNERQWGHYKGKTANLNYSKPELSKDYLRYLEIYF